MMTDNIGTIPAATGMKVRDHQCRRARVPLSTLTMPFAAVSATKSLKAEEP